MATEVVTQVWCDAHLDEQDERVTGEPVTVRIELPGEPSVTYVADLCEACRAPFTALRARLAAYGRPAGGNARPEPEQPQNGLISGSLPAVLVPGVMAELVVDGKVRCPVCDERHRSTGMLTKHLLREHDSSIAEQLGVAHTRCPVGTCSRLFLDARGAGRHMVAAHRRVTGEVA